MKSRRNKPFFTFFKALVCSLLGLSLYILGRKVIPFPEKWMQADKNHSLFFIGIFGHLFIGWIIGIFFMFFDPEKSDPEKVKKWRNWISTVLISFYFIIYSWISYWDFVKVKLSYIALLTLISLIIKCLIDALIQWMNKNGVCSGFSLLLFVEFLPTKWFANTLFPNLRDNWQGKTSWTEGGLIRQPWFCMLLLLAISIFFIWIVNLKWEIPVESNVTYFDDNPLIKKHRFKLGFRINFPFMALYQLAQALGYIFIGWKLIKGVPLPNPHSNWLLRKAQQIQLVSSDLSRKSVIWEGGKESIGESFFLLNNKKRLFGNLFNWIGRWEGIILLTLLILILFRWLVMWFSIRKLNLETRKISDKLKRRGVYANNLYPGKQTKTLLKKIINYLICFWFCIVLIFNIVFDQIFARLERPEVAKVALGLPEIPGQFFPRFLDWFGSVGIGTELYRQIKTKYKYIQRN